MSLNWLSYGACVHVKEKHYRLQRWCGNTLKVINPSDEVKSVGLFRFELFHECVETAVNLCFEILILVFGKKMFQGIFSVGNISITSETKQPLKTMISMVLSGYVAYICAAAIITSGILCGLFYES